MNWETFCVALKTGELFGPFRELSLADRIRRLRWTPVLTTDLLLQELIYGKLGAWTGGAIRANTEYLKPTLSLILERQLLNLKTRVDPTPLYRYWDWILGHTSQIDPYSAMKSVWLSREKAIHDTLPEGEFSLNDIAEQEANFHALLAQVEGELSPLRDSVLDWAYETVSRLAERTKPGTVSEPLQCAQARVVFARKAPPEGVRPALLLDFELQSQAIGPQVEPSGLFEGGFTESVGFVTQKVGRRFHRLVLRPTWKPTLSPDKTDTQEPSHACLVDSHLDGDSGGLAILLAQHLADRRAGTRRKSSRYTLAPWVVATAAIDSSAELPVRPVGALHNKVEVLVEEGVRVVLLAEDSKQLTEARSALKRLRGVRLHPCISPSTSALAEVLVKQRCAWATDIERWKLRLRDRREVIVAAGAIGMSALGGGLWAGAKYFSDERPLTRAMKAHEPKQIREKVAEIKDYFSNPNASREGYFQEKYGLTGPVISSPTLTDCSKLRILHDSRLFDSSEWKKVPQAELLTTQPFEPAYFTREIVIQKNSADAPEEFVTRLDTGGLAVFPLIDARSGWSVSYKIEQMRESKAKNDQVFTTYLRIPISHLGNNGEPFTLKIQAAWFNGAQDQHLRGAHHDWWGVRAIAGTENTDLAVYLPSDKGFRNVEHVVRKEGGVVETVREGDPLWAPAGQEEGTYIDGPRSVWVIPTSPSVKTAPRWIFSIQWRWK